MLKSVCFAMLLVACAGSDGRDGADGTNGTNGMDGMNGTNGQDGMDGMDGSNGSGGSGVRTIVVSPGATATASGTNLANALQLFVADPTKASATKPWLIKVEPGIYDVGALGIAMQPFVDIEGSGEMTTTITGTGTTLVTTDGVELRALTVKCTGATCAAIKNDGDFPVLTHVTAIIQATTLGVAIWSLDGGPTLHDVTVIASGVDAQGIEIDAGTAFLRNVDITASGTGTTGPGGINVFDGTAFIKDSTIGAYSTNGTDPAVGIFVGRSNDAADLELDDVYVVADTNGGVAIQVDSIVTATPQGVRIRNSALIADLSVQLLDDEMSYVLSANTQLTGNFDTGSGDVNFFACSHDIDALLQPLSDGVADTTNAGGACL